MEKKSTRASFVLLVVLSTLSLAFLDVFGRIFGHVLLMLPFSQKNLRLIDVVTTGFVSLVVFFYLSKFFTGRFSRYTGK